MPGFNLCAEFAIFPDNHVLGPAFSLAGFSFNQLLGGNPMFTNDTGGERGLQFPLEGIEITLPIPVRSVTLRLGTFAGPVDIEALDSAGAVVRRRSVPGLNAYIDLRFSAPDIAALRLAGGGNEALIPKICVAIFTP